MDVLGAEAAVWNAERSMKDGSVRAFAFLFNGKGEQGDSARRLFDALAVELVQ
jgi:hypothetical protein